MRRALPPHLDRVALPPCQYRLCTLCVPIVVVCLRDAVFLFYFFFVWIACVCASVREIRRLSLLCLLDDTLDGILLSDYQS